MSDTYRFDTRTPSAFAKQILEDSRSEAVIALRLCVYEYQQTGVWPVLIPTGTDMSGEFVKKTMNVTQQPDFFIGNNLVEITRADPVCKKNFHQKVSKMKLALKNGYDVVFVNGFRDEKEPMFVKIDSKTLALATDLAIQNFGIVPMPSHGKGIVPKDAYRYALNWFDGLWKKLPQISSNLPSNYDDVLKVGLKSSKELSKVQS